MSVDSCSWVSFVVDCPTSWYFLSGLVGESTTTTRANRQQKWPCFLPKSVFIQSCRSPSDWKDGWHWNLWTSRWHSVQKWIVSLSWNEIHTNFTKSGGSFMKSPCVLVSQSISCCTWLSDLTLQKHPHVAFLFLGKLHWCAVNKLIIAVISAWILPVFCVTMHVWTVSIRTLYIKCCSDWRLKAGTKARHVIYNVKQLMELWILPGILHDNWNGLFAHHHKLPNDCLGWSCFLCNMFRIRSIPIMSLVERCIETKQRFKTCSTSGTLLLVCLSRHWKQDQDVCLRWYLWDL